MKRYFWVAAILFAASATYADINVTEGSGKTVKTSTIGGKEIQEIAIYASSNTVVLGAGTAEIGNVKNAGTFAVQSTLQTGTNNIGTVTGSTVTVINPVGGTLAVSDGGGSLTVDGTVTASQSSAYTVNLSTSIVGPTGTYIVCTSTFANIAASQTGSSLVGAVTSTVLRVMAVNAVAGGTATNLTFNSNSTAISPLYANAANGGIVLPYNPLGWFSTASGEGLTATTGTGATTGINVTYCKI